jgi:hypothetical protein
MCYRNDEQGYIEVPSITGHQKTKFDYSEISLHIAPSAQIKANCEPKHWKNLEQVQIILIMSRIIK